MRSRRVPELRKWVKSGSRGREALSRVRMRPRLARSVR